MKEIEKFKRRRAERKLAREDGECGKKNLRVEKVEWNKDGGKGSGNFGHAGRVGEVGGSAPSGGGKGKTDVSNWKTKSRYEVGSTVAISPKWLDKGEPADFLYEVIEDKGDRSLIAPKEWTGALRPTQTVSNDMLVAPNKIETMISSAIEEYNNKTPDEKIAANNELLDKYKKELEEAQKEFDYQKVKDLKFEIGQIKEENAKLKREK